ncbi:chitin synthase-domain-containing protein [Pisolithus orientalis]|uniref:chitin synthase-domain-containing protein n=1 Tax=Pisolithus orientalis TaxID=936130 RepID=UPI0022250BD3|nr:chitin synthase-domain-containing protein [Pisolithus orientalis]KAI6006642.1 chitin synthase-domain-containing protein [Pisolithus orientalis]
MQWNNHIGYVGYMPSENKDMANSGSSLRILNGLIYDLTTYLNYLPAVIMPTGTQVGRGVNTQFMSSTIVNLSSSLLVLLVLMVSIIGFKFIALINFGAVHAPEDHDKFMICQVPCYTEGKTSLWHTIHSLAVLKYDNKRKLIFIMCNGNIVRSGNNCLTPCIVLDILSADPNLDPELLSFHNMAKVYSGLYKCAGHVMPYLVVVKVRKLTERSHPRNCVMHFLNKVHYNTLMNPLELKMYHQIKNVISINLTFYEYLFAVNADTTAEPYALNCLMSVMIHDKKVLGMCGETSLTNAKQLIVTMMQVYKYFISHHMAKAFESLFGLLTCLPSCFTLFHLCTPDTHKPLLVSNQITQDYSQNHMQFIRDTHAEMVTPDDWKVLLSQHHHWINSTIHNLGELMFLDQLCGFCCFSMHFIVMMDLILMLTQPITITYIVYLIMLVIYEHSTIPFISLVMIAAVYGLKALVFILHHKWDMDKGKFDPHSILLKTWNDYHWLLGTPHPILQGRIHRVLYCIPV